MRVLVDGTVDRAIVLFGADTDPGPEATWTRGVTLSTAGSSMIRKDPGGQSNQNPSGSSTAGVVGVSAAGIAALAFAVDHPALVDRLVLVATAIPADETALGFELSAVTAKVLLLYGAKDPLTGSRHGTWWQRRLPSARLEMVPQGGHELLVPVWDRILSHVAPHCKRH